MSNMPRLPRGNKKGVASTNRQLSLAGLDCMMNSTLRSFVLGGLP